MMTSQPARLAATISLFVLAACGDDATTGLVAELSIDPSIAEDTTAAADRVIDFGDVVIGTSATRTLRVNNLGRAPMALEALTIKSPFEVDDASARTVEGEDSTDFSLFFLPLEAGILEQVVSLNSDGGNATVRLVGRGVERGSCLATVAPSSVAFGSAPLGTAVTRKILVTNPGDEECKIGSIILSNDTDAEFTLGQAPAGGTLVTSGAPVVIEVVFEPTKEADSHGQLVVTLGTGGTHGVLLSGQGIDVPTAEEPGYLNTGAQLWRFDPQPNAGQDYAWGRKNFNGEASSWSMVDIAIDNNGVLYGISNKKLWIIDPTSAYCIFIADLDAELTSPDGLTVLPDGRLIAADNQLVEIDPQTAQIVDVIVPQSAEYDTSGDVIALPDGMLYWTVRTGGDDKLLRVDPDSGDVTDLGSIGVKGAFGLAYAQDTLFAFTTDGDVLVINPENGDVEDDWAVPGKWWGATSNPTQW